MRIALVSSSLAHYRIPFLNRVATIPGLEIHALLGEATERARDWHVNLSEAKFDWTVYPSTVVPLRTKRADETSLFLSPRLWQHLLRTRYDVVIAMVWTMPNSAMALLIRRLQNRPVLLWDTSIPHAPSRIKQMLMPAIRTYFDAFDGYLAASTLCKEYMISCGAARDKVILLPQAIDNDYFRTQAQAFSAQREHIKQSLGLSGKQVILYVGRFTENKGLLVLLEAFKQLALQNPNAALLFVGSGVLKQGLINRAAAYGLGDRVVFAAPVENLELPRYYSIADVFVLPTYYDTFGVVVNEAMASGLPIVTTFAAGSAQDLIRQGVNGSIVEPGNPKALADALHDVLKDDERRAEMGRQSIRIISTWTIDVAAKNLVDGLATIVPPKT